MNIGYALSLLCGLGWSIGIILFKAAGDKVHPLALNAYKNLVGFLLMIPTAFILGGFHLHEIPSNDMVILLISGMIGIGIADGLALRCLQLIGASRFAILETVYSPCVILFSILYLSERLTLFQCLGTAAILTALLLVASPSGRTQDEGKSNLRVGIAIGLFAFMTMAAGIVMVKPLLASTELFSVILMRLASGSIGSLAFCLISPDRRSIWKSWQGADRKTTLFVASLFTTYIANILWVAGFKYISASTAAVLNQLSTFYTVILAVIFLKESLTVKKVFATLIAVMGVVMITVE